MHMYIDDETNIALQKQMIAIDTINNHFIWMCDREDQISGWDIDMDGILLSKQSLA